MDAVFRGPFIPMTDMHSHIRGLTARCNIT